MDKTPKKANKGWQTYSKKFVKVTSIELSTVIYP